MKLQVRVTVTVRSGLTAADRFHGAYRDGDAGSRIPVFIRNVRNGVRANQKPSVQSLQTDFGQTRACIILLLDFVCRFVYGFDDNNPTDRILAA